MFYIDLNLQRIQNYPYLASIPSTDSSIHLKWEQECGTILFLSRPNQAHFHYQHFTDWDAIHNPIRFDMTMKDNAFYSSFETPTNPVSFPLSPSPNTDAHFAPG